jgi:hypothetical protein
LNLKDYIAEIKIRIIQEQSGTELVAAIKRWLNMSRQHIRTMENWKVLRRKRTLTTEGDYTTGTINAITNGDVAITGALTVWVTADIRPGRRILINDDTQGRVITAVTGEGALTIATGYGGTTSAVAGLSYTILGTEEYSLPYDWGDLGFFWHEIYGYPFKLTQAGGREFYDSNLSLDESSIPQLYRLWGEDAILAQPSTASAITASCASASDTTQTVRIAGIVSSYPDFEDLALTGGDTTGTKLFSRIDRISIFDNATTPTPNVGRVSITSNTAAITNAVIPVNFVNRSLSYNKVQFYPIPDDEYTINAECYDRLLDLVDDNDVCPLGKEFDEAIILWACYIGRKYDQDALQAEQMRKDFDREISRLRAWNNKDNDYFKYFRSRDDSLTKNSFLNFGPYYPKVYR